MLYGRPGSSRGDSLPPSVLRTCLYSARFLWKTSMTGTWHHSLVGCLPDLDAAAPPKAPVLQGLWMGCTFRERRGKSSYRPLWKSADGGQATTWRLLIGRMTSQPLAGRPATRFLLCHKSCRFHRRGHLHEFDLHLTLQLVLCFFLPQAAVAPGRIAQSAVVMLWWGLHGEGMQGERSAFLLLHTSPTTPSKRSAP